MEELKQKTKLKLPTTQSKEISVIVYAENLKDKSYKVVEIDTILDKFPNSMAGGIFKRHNIRFVTCLKAFLEHHLGGKVEPMFEIDEIIGVSHKDISYLEKLCLKRMR
ncbi:MAG: hypothetical protein AAF717_21600 [Bacteroidota bacterium]